MKNLISIFVFTILMHFSYASGKYIRITNPITKSQEVIAHGNLETDLQRITKNYRLKKELVSSEVVKILIYKNKSNHDDTMIVTQLHHKYGWVSFRGHHKEYGKIINILIADVYNF